VSYSAKIFTCSLPKLQRAIEFGIILAQKLLSPTYGSHDHCAAIPGKYRGWRYSLCHYLRAEEILEHAERTEPCPHSPTATEFFDDMATRRSVVGSCILWAISAAVLYIAVLYSGYLLRHGHLTILALCWVSLIAIASSLPRIVRGYIEAFHGKPALRLDQRGIWARDWASLGWIEWPDIEVMLIARARNLRDLQLKLRNEQKYLLRMSWIDRLSLATLRLFDRFLDLFPHDGPPAYDRAIVLTSSALLNAQWDPLMTALAPILAAKGIPLEEDIDEEAAA
jgi:hypothetical protein